MSKELDTGYTSEVDTMDECTWYAALEKFHDANIYQTWAFGDVTSGEDNISHLVLRKYDEITAIAQVRTMCLPIIGAGIAYVQWGPIWRQNGITDSWSEFRQAIRALRNEYVCKRRLTLRLVPPLFEQNSSGFVTLLAEEGFVAEESERSRTILMDLGGALEDIREGLAPHWKRELKIAERNRLQVYEGTGDDLLQEFVQIYREMVERKGFLEPNDIQQFRRIQAQLPDRLKMKTMLCADQESVCAGLVCSVIGHSAIYLFGATSNAGKKSRGSYLLHWKLIEALKRDGVAVYDLNGINPAKNPGTYKFKSDLGGKSGSDVYFLGRFASRGSLISRLCVQCGDVFRRSGRRYKEHARAAKHATQVGR